MTGTDLHALPSHRAERTDAPAVRRSTAALRVLFLALAAFQMPGRWTVTLDIGGAGGRDSVTFELMR